MKLVTFIQDGTRRLGALQAAPNREVVIDLNQADARLPSDMLAFLEGGARMWELAQACLERLDAARPLSEVRLLAPIPRPGKIICIGLNYRDHAEETKQAIPAYPTIFSKYANAVIGPEEAIVIPKVSQEIDYEGELAIVIGRRGRYIPEKAALEYVAGYMPFNDVSARDFQRRTSQWVIGKTFDTFAPMGPALVTADEVPDPHCLDIRTIVSGEVLQASNTRHLIFGVPYLVSYISQVMTLEPGDIISSGTPGGVGFTRTPPRFLRPGDVVHVEIERLGRLSNVVVAEAQ